MAGGIDEGLELAVGDFVLIEKKSVELNHMGGLFIAVFK